MNSPIRRKKKNKKLEQAFHKVRYKRENKFIQICSLLVIMGTMNTKATMTYHFYPLSVNWGGCRATGKLRHC